MDKLIAAQNAGVVIGLKDVSGVHPREDIDILLTEKRNVFNLYLLALAEIQAEEEGKPQDKMGYFSIAGIHGLPNQYWDKVEAPPRPGFQAKVGGYCAHGYDLFPTWHRPYIAMMEQTIYAKVQDIAKRYTNPEVAQTYKAAAITFRLPFWDYFRPRGGEVIFPGIVGGNKETRYAYDFSMPRILTEENVMVRKYPDNELKSIQNPLYKYDFPKDQSKTISTKEWESLFNSPVNTAQGQKFFSYSMLNTTRYPHDSAPDKSSTDKMNQALNKDREGKTTTFLNFLTELYKDYDEFATNGHFELDKDGAKIFHSSLEQLHGDYHGTIGGVSINEKLMGHMGRVPVAAFDPVFWLHHCNIDRIFAIYQATHPNTWLPKTKVGETFVDEMALYPFRKIARQGATDDVKNFWTSLESKKCETFGYRYPHLHASSSPEQVRAKFEELHSWSVRKSPTDSFGKPPKEMEYINVSKAQVFDFDKKTSFVPDAPRLSNFVEDSIQTGISAITNVVQKPFALGSSTSDVILRQWYVDIAVLRHSQNGAFTLYYFIGDSKRIGRETEDYLIKPTLAGLTHVFVAPSDACDNCAQQAQANQLAIDSTPINPILLDYIEIGKLASLEPEDVKPFLTDNLRWRIVTINQDSIHPSDEGLGLEVSISASLIRGGAAVGYETYPEIAEDIISQAGL